METESNEDNGEGAQFKMALLQHPETIQTTTQQHLGIEAGRQTTTFVNLFTGAADTSVVIREMEEQDHLQGSNLGLKEMPGHCYCKISLSVQRQALDFSRVSVRGSKPMHCLMEKKKKQ